MTRKQVLPPPDDQYGGSNPDVERSVREANYQMVVSCNIAIDQLHMHRLVFRSLDKR